MDVTKVNYYESCDKAIRSMNRANVEAFGRLKMARWDEINLIRTVTSVYFSGAERARKKYRKVGYDAYILGCLICRIDENDAKKMAEKAITLEWIDEILERTDFVTLYRFDTEMERKAYRLAEALEASTERNREIDKALRYWSQQLGQYAINVTDEAILQAYKDNGVEMVEWLSMKDARVCSECYALNGQIFPVDEVPPKPHWGCRCRLRPVFRKKED